MIWGYLTQAKKAVVLQGIKIDKTTFPTSTFGETISTACSSFYTAINTLLPRQLSLMFEFLSHLKTDVQIGIE